MATPTQSNDQGQRYEVWAINAAGDKIRIGWTNQASGGGVVDVVLRHPTLHSPEVIDRTPGIERFVETPFKAGCKKCLEQVYAGRDNCRYCNCKFKVAHGRIS